MVEVDWSRRVTGKPEIVLKRAENLVREELIPPLVAYIVHSPLSVRQATKRDVQQAFQYRATMDVDTRHQFSPLARALAPQRRSRRTAEVGKGEKVLQRSEESWAWERDSRKEVSTSGMSGKY